MKTLMTNTQAMMAVTLGCCVAMGTEAVIVGYAFENTDATRNRGEYPPADLRTYFSHDDFLYVEALTVNGLAFMQLVREGCV